MRAIAWDAANRPGCVSMCFATGRIGHEAFEIRLIRGDPEQLLPNAFVPPKAKSLVDAVAIAVFRRQIASGRTGTENPYDLMTCIGKETIVLCNTTPITLIVRASAGQSLIRNSRNGAIPCPSVSSRLNSNRKERTPTAFFKSS